MGVIEDLSRWLGITKQQTDIIRAIYNLQEQKLETSPKNIIREYEKLVEQPLQRPNLFSQLRILMEEKLVTKTAKARYNMSLEGVKARLGNKKQELISELKSFENVSTGVDEFFMKISQGSEEPSIRHLKTYKMFYDELQRQVSTADMCYLSTSFPTLSFTKLMLGVYAKPEYGMALYKRTCEERALKVKYLTNLDIDEIITVVKRKYPDTKRVYDEISILFKRITQLLENFDNIEIFYSPHPFGFDIVLPIVKEDISKLVLYMRNVNREVVGGIFIRSPEIALRAEEHFRAECQRSIDLRSEQGKEVIEKKLKELKNKIKTQSR